MKKTVISRAVSFTLVLCFIATSILATPAFLLNVSAEEESIVVMEDFENQEVAEWEKVYEVGGSQTVEVTDIDPLQKQKSLLLSNNSNAESVGAKGLYAQIDKEFGTNDIVVRLKRNDTSGGVFRIAANASTDRYAHEGYTLFSKVAPVAYNYDGTINRSVTYNSSWEGYEIPANFDGYLFMENDQSVNISSLCFGMVHNSFPADVDNVIIMDSIASYVGTDLAKIMSLTEAGITDGTGTEEKLVTEEYFETSDIGDWQDTYAVGGRQSISITEENALQGEKSLLLTNNSTTGAGGANGLYAKLDRDFGANDMVVRIKRNNTSNGVFRIVANSTNYAHDSYTLLSTTAPVAYNFDGTLNESVTYRTDWEGYEIPANFDGYLFVKNDQGVNITSLSFGMAHNSFPENVDHIIMMDSIASYTGTDYAKIIALLKPGNQVDINDYFTPMKDVDFSDDFSSASITNLNWKALMGSISVENAEMGISNDGFSNAMVDNKTWGDAQFEFDLKVGDGGWSAFQFRKQQLGGTHESKGYTLYFAENGGYELLAGDGAATRSIGGGANAAPDGTTSIKVKVVTKGKHIQVYVNDMQTPAIDKEDDAYLSGYAGFLKQTGTTHIGDFKVTNVGRNSMDILGDDFNLGTLNPDKWELQKDENTQEEFLGGKLILKGTGVALNKQIIVSSKKHFRVYEGEPLEIQHIMSSLSNQAAGFVQLYQDESNWLEVGLANGSWYYQSAGDEAKTLIPYEKVGEKVVNVLYDNGNITVFLNGEQAATVPYANLTDEITIRYGARAVEENAAFKVKFDECWAQGNGLYPEQIPSDEEFIELVNSLQIKNPEKDQLTLDLPEVQEAYKIKIKSSSDENLINLEGKIGLPNQEKSTDIVLTVTRRWDNTSKNSGKIHVVVPKATTAEDMAADILKTIQMETYIDQKKYNLPNVAEPFTVKIHSSSNTNVIALDGGMTPPETDKTVILKFEIENTLTGDSYVSEDYKISVVKKTDILELNFFKQLKYGIFVHYVWGGQSKVTMNADGSYPTDPDEMVMDAEKFASDCEEMGVQYIILTAWHAGMNPLYPSEVYKKYRKNHNDVPENDILMPILDELKERNIEVLFYTHPADGHDLRPEDKEALGYEMGPNGDYEKWNEYITAQYKELCERYKGKFRGMFIDEGLMDYNNEVFVDYPRLRNTIKSVDSSLIMMQNHYTGKYSADTAMIENANQWDADINNLDTWATFQYPTGYTLTTENNWAAIKNQDYEFPADHCASVEDMFVFTVMQAASNTEGGGATWAAGPYTGGAVWENGMLETLKAIGGYIKPIETSIKNTLPSTSYITTAGTRISKLDWGVATKSVDSTKEYIHVLKAPDSNTLILPAPDDGKLFTSAKLVKNGKEVVLKQAEDGAVTLTLPEGESWDTYDTAIELTVDIRDYLNRLIFSSESFVNSSLWSYTTAGVMQYNNALVAAKAAVQDDNGDYAQAIVNLQDALTVLGVSEQYYAAKENLAQDAAVTASSDIPNSVEWSVNNVVDGDRYCKLPFTNWNYTNRAKGWSSSNDLSNPNHTEWIQLQLANPSSVGAVYLYPRNDKDAIGGGFPIDFSIEVSENGTDWTTVYTAVNYLRPDGTVQKFLFPTEENVQYIRITGTKLRSDGDRGKDASYRMQLAEIEVYNELGNIYTMEPQSLIKRKVNTVQGMKPEMPSSIVAIYPNNEQREVPVVWDEIAEDRYAEPGEFDVMGTISGVEQKASCTVHVAEKLTVSNKNSYDIPASTVGQAISNIDLSKGVSGGMGSYKYIAEGLPKGISIDPDTGIIGGTPTSVSDAGKAKVTVSDDVSSVTVTIKYGEIKAAKEDDKKEEPEKDPNTGTEPETGTENGTGTKTDTSTGKDVPKTEQAGKPVKTGDTSNVWGYLGLLLTGGAVIVYFVVRKKKVNR